MSALARNEESEVSRVERRSGDDRYVSIFRAGKLSRDGIEELCVLRNISAGGAMIAHNSPLETGDRISLDLRLDEHFEATIAWVKGDRSGLYFDTPIGTLMDPSRARRVCGSLPRPV